MKAFFVGAARIFSLVLFCGASNALATDLYYVGAGSGAAATWNSPNNWSTTPNGPGGAGVPGSTDIARLDFADAISRTIRLTAAGSANELRLGNAGGGTETFNQATFDLTLSNEQIATADSSVGAHVQDGGTTTITNGLTISGRYPFTYSALTTPVGAYTINDGTFAAGFITVSAGGRGDFFQNGGNVAINSLNVGLQGPGTYHLAGGTLAVATNEMLGPGGQGTFDQTGGTHIVGSPSVSTPILLGNNNPTGLGIYSLSGNASQLTVYGDELIGYLSPGMFNQSNGTNTVYGTFEVGSARSGTSNFSGGTINALGGMGVGNAIAFGRMVQTGGSIFVGTASQPADLSIGSGSYTLSGSSSVLKVYGNEINTRGTFEQTGGTHSVAGDFNLAPTADRTARFTLGGSGNLSVGNLNVGGTSAGPSAGLATFDVTGASSFVAGHVTVWAGGAINYSGGSFNAAELFLSETGAMSLTAGNNKVLRVGRFSTSHSIGARLDLSDNSMIIDYGSAPLGGPAQIVETFIEQLNEGDIYSSSSDALHRIGYADNHVLHRGAFAGQLVTLDDLLIRYTFVGDADLNGTVDVADFTRFFSNFGQRFHATWTQGDFDYNGTVDVADFTLFFSAFGQSGLAPTPAMIPFMNLANVPEPRGLLWVVWAILPVFTRRNRVISLSARARAVML